MKIFTDRGFQQLLDQWESTVWYWKRRATELEKSLTAERVLRTTTEVKLDAALQDNQSLIANRDYLEEMARAAKRDLLARDKEIRELKLRLGSIESRWGQEAAI